MMRRHAPLLLVAALCRPGAVQALGLGELTLNSYLNEPLRAEVELLELGDLDPSQVKIRLATREDFTRAGVEREYFLTSLKFDVLTNDGVRLLITSNLPVREPYLNFIVEARWPTGRLLREYTVLLDPPVFVGSDSGITARASSRETQQRAQQRATPAAGTAARDTPTGERPSSDRRPAQREFDAGATDRPESGERYLVRRDDTLWRIAESARPRGASVQQTMLDIQRLNPEAFIDGNINRLKAGYVLRLPTADEIMTRSYEEAVSEVAAQTERWQRGVSEPRVDASEPVDYAGQADSARGEGHLQIAAADEDQPAATGEGGLSARMEDLDRVERENSDLARRLRSLEQQIQMQERLISLKDEQIAALQGALTRAGTAQPDAARAAAQREGSLAAEDALPNEDPVIDSMPDVADTISGAAPPTQPESRPAPQPAPPPPQQPSIIDMLRDQILYVGGALLLLLLGLLYLLRNRLPGLRRGGDQPLPSRGGEDEDEFAGVRLSDDSLIVDEFAEDSEFEHSAVEPIKTSKAPDEEAYAAQFESGDALAEADIYIAYGRFPQAVDLLKTAIGVEPINTDYRMKLIEACVEMVDREEFQQQYADLEVIGDENTLARARSLVDAVDGGEVWLEDLPAPSLSEMDVAAARSVQAAETAADEEAQALREVDLGLDAESLEGDASGDLDLDLAEEILDDDDLAPIEYVTDDAGEEIDTEFDADQEAGDALDAALDDADAVEAIPERRAASDASTVVRAAAGAAARESAGRHLDEGVDLDDIEAGARMAGDLDTADATAQEEPLQDLGEFDLDVDQDAVDTARLDADEPEVASDTGVGDFDMSFDDAQGEDLPDLASELEEVGTEELASEAEEFDLSDFSSDAELEMDFTTEEPAATEAAADDADALTPELSSDEDVDLGDFEIDGDLADTEIALGGGESASEAELESLELDVSAQGDDGEEEGLIFAEDGDEVATKLDLARAYIDMGDHDGARSILDEVIGEGSESQQAEAQSLLEGID